MNNGVCTPPTSIDTCSIGESRYDIGSSSDVVIVGGHVERVYTLTISPDTFHDLVPLGKNRKDHKPFWKKFVRRGKYG